jgi:predicted nucleic acid-binding protein
MTTVQVGEDTRRLLEKLKKGMGLGTYDEVIKRLASTDSLIYATARSRAAQIVSGDAHFKGLKDVIFIA